MDPLEMSKKNPLSCQKQAALRDGALDLAIGDPCGGRHDSIGVGVVCWAVDVVLVHAELALFIEH